MSEPTITFKGKEWTKAELVDGMAKMITAREELIATPDAEHPVGQAGATEMVYTPSQDVTPHA